MLGENSPRHFHTNRICLIYTDDVRMMYPCTSSGFKGRDEHAKRNDFKACRTCSKTIKKHINITKCCSKFVKNRGDHQHETHVDGSPLYSETFRVGFGNLYSETFRLDSETFPGGFGNFPVGFGNFSGCIR